MATVLATLTRFRVLLIALARQGTASRNSALPWINIYDREVRV